MTTTVSIKTQSTVTSVLDTTETAIVEAIKELDLRVINDQTQVEMSQTQSANGITLMNKNSTPTTSTSTISTFTTKVTSSSTLRSNETSSSGSTPLEPLSTPTSSVVTSTVSSAHQTHSNQVAQSNSLFRTSTSTSNSTNVGLIIGIPIAVIGSALLVLGLWFYLRKRKDKSKEADEKLNNYYDDKYNYKISPMQDMGSPYGFKTTFQVEKNRGFNNSRDFHTDTSKAPSSNFSSKNPSELSLKEPSTGAINSNWNLSTPLSKWFAKHSRLSGVSSGASLSTGPRSPLIVLKEFNLGRSRAKNTKSVLVNEKSPILPKFPENAYHPYNNSNLSYGLTDSSSNTLSKQVIHRDFTHLHQNVPKMRNTPPKKLKNKPLPKKPDTIRSASSSTTLEGLEQRVHDKMIPSSKINKYFHDENIYQVAFEYHKQLEGELTIKRGEYFKILARHTDGWCLVEKCNSDGEVLAEGRKYINDGRGVVPEMCLVKLKK